MTRYSRRLLGLRLRLSQSMIHCISNSIDLVERDDHGFEDLPEQLSRRPTHEYLRKYPTSGLPWLERKARPSRPSKLALHVVRIRRFPPSSWKSRKPWLGPRTIQPGSTTKVGSKRWQRLLGRWQWGNPFPMRIAQSKASHRAYMGSLANDVNSFAETPKPCDGWRCDRERRPFSQRPDTGWRRAFGT